MVAKPSDAVLNNPQRGPWCSVCWREYDSSKHVMLSSGDPIPITPKLWFIHREENVGGVYYCEHCYRQKGMGVFLV